MAQLNARPPSDARLGMDIYPTSNSIPHEWGGLVHEYALALRALVGEIRDRVFSRDPNLSDQGEKRRRAQLAREGIGRIRNSNAPSASRLVGVLTARRDAMLSTLPGRRAPETANEVRLAGQAAELIRGMRPVERHALARTAAREPALFWALEHTPAFVLGVTEEERLLLLRSAKEAANPEDAAEIRALAESIEAVELAEEHAVGFVAAFGGIEWDSSAGEWVEAPTVHEPQRPAGFPGAG